MVQGFLVPLLEMNISALILVVFLPMNKFGLLEIRGRGETEESRSA